MVDLLIAMANAACRSSRQKLIFDPYPTVVDPTKPSELALNPVVSTNFESYWKLQQYNLVL